MKDKALPDAIGGSDACARRSAIAQFLHGGYASIGPFLGVFLQSKGWATGPIGTVMTVGGIAGMAMTAPAGAFIDHTTRKRLVVVITGSARSRPPF